MSFIDVLKSKPDGREGKYTITKTEGENKTPSVKVLQINEAKKPEEILRGANKKIRLVTPTTFGTQIDFAKKYDDNEIKELLKDFTIKIKQKSVFIVD
jgi:hypothetical protein